MDMVKRYTHDGFKETISEDADGEFVDYEDYAALQQQLSLVENNEIDARCFIVELEKHINQFAAENATLKKVANIDSYDKCDSCGYESYVMPVETPYTDAFLLNAQADGVDKAISNILEIGIPDSRMQLLASLTSFVSKLRAQATALQQKGDK